LIGPVTAQWYFEELQEKARSLGVGDRMTVIPGLSPDSEELLQALQTAYCFILPSRHEPFGIAALEALDAEIPLIASAVGGLRDFLVDGENALLFEDNDIDSLCRAYDRVAVSAEKIVSGGRKTADKYNWQSIALKLTGIYRELL
jgi:glycosyltransferase involved in cell wall biosynthesis